MCFIAVAAGFGGRWCDLRGLDANRLGAGGLLHLLGGLGSLSRISTGIPRHGHLGAFLREPPLSSSLRGGALRTSSDAAVLDREILAQGSGQHDAGTAGHARMRERGRTAKSGMRVVSSEALNLIQRRSMVERRLPIGRQVSRNEESGIEGRGRAHCEFGAARMTFGRQRRDRFVLTGTGVEVVGEARGPDGDLCGRRSPLLGAFTAPRRGHSSELVAPALALKPRAIVSCREMPPRVGSFEAAQCDTASPGDRISTP